MKTFIWKDQIKIVTGEITRPAQMRLGRAIGNLQGFFDDMTDDEAVAYLDNMMALAATRAIYVKVDDEWQTIFAEGDSFKNGVIRTVMDVGEGRDVEINGETFHFSHPLDPALLMRLPASLTYPWLDNVQEENGYVINRFLSVLNSLTRQPTATESPSASAPSSEP